MTADKGQKQDAPRRTGVQPGAILRALQRGESTEVSPVVPRAAGETSKPASVTVIEDGNRVQRIVAHCECGRKIEIECDYDDSPPA